jgi:hypothetical protein
MGRLLFRDEPPVALCPVRWGAHSSGSCSGTPQPGEALLSQYAGYGAPALWIMSIFGNYGDMPAWERAKQIELFHWSILFGLVACGAIYHGLKYENGITKGFGLTFLFINFYTRYFELFWNSMHKALLFAVLGISFWYLGTKAEKIWNIGRSDSR